LARFGVRGPFGPRPGSSSGVLPGSSSGRGGCPGRAPAEALPDGDSPAGFQAVARSGCLSLPGVSLAVRSAFYRNLAVSVADWILISDVGSTNKLQLPAMFAFCDFVNEGDKFPWSSQISLRHVSHSKMRTLVLVSMFQRLSTKRDEEPQLGQLGLRDSADWLDSIWSIKSPCCETHSNVRNDSNAQIKQRFRRLTFANGFPSGPYSCSSLKMRSRSCWWSACVSLMVVSTAWAPPRVTTVAF
jgi:hypothetical protein